MIKHLLYAAYYIRHTSPEELSRWIRFVRNEKGCSTAFLLRDMLFSSFKYKISFFDYFSFRFYNLNPTERCEFLGAGGMYEYQLKMNPRKHRKVLADKTAFLQKFNDLSGRQWASLDMLRKNEMAADVFLGSNEGKVVLKNAQGQSGKQVEIFDSGLLTRTTLIELMKKKNYDLVETYVVQHDKLMRLSPSGVNTVRLITQLHRGEVIIIAARLRISVNSKLDNVSAGNLITAVDKDTGKVIGPGMYHDITRSNEYVHPVTGIELMGFEIPFWNQCIQLVKEAALRIPENRSVGWDVAITNSKPVLIEGNHNWHYLSLQMPVLKGFKKELIKYLY